MKKINKKIAMWSGPRNISTALMRSFVNRSDTVVLDEPFYAHYLYVTGINHPGKNEILAKQKTNWEEIVYNITGSVPENKSIWYQKHMAQHNLPGNDLSWTKQMTNCFLIRRPEEVIASYNNIHKVDNELLLGFKQQAELFRYILKNTGRISTVINSKTILKNPRSALETLCFHLNINFSENMLKWLPGIRKSDGVWAKYWYKTVKHSTGFAKYKKKELRINSKMRSLINLCRPDYEFLKKYQI